MTVVKRSLVIFNECCDTDWDVFDFETFAFISSRDFSLTRQAPESYPDFYPRAYIDLHLDNGALENYFASSTLGSSGGEDWHNPKTVGMKRNSGDVYLIIKMAAEQNWRHAFFEEVANGTTISLNTSEMETVPMSAVETPSDYESSLEILGIRNCDKHEFLTIQSYAKGENGVIPARYSEGIFDRFRSKVTLRKGDETFQFHQLGAPVDFYFPSPLGFNVEDKNIQNFKLSHNSTPTVFEADWHFHTTEFGFDLISEVNWKVWSDFPQDFKAPKLPTCITDESDWINLDDLRLQSVTERKYSSIANYSDYINFYLENRLNPIGCFESNFNMEGTLEVKTKWLW